MNREMVSASVRLRVIAAILLLGAAFHLAAAFVPAAAESIGSATPTWRHLLFAGMETALALLVIRRTRWLVLAFALLLGQQLTTHGVALWRTWAVGHRMDWVSLAVLVFLAYALLEVFMDGRRRVRSRHDSHRPVDLSNAQ